MSEPGNKFYIVTGQRVACLERATGEVIWKTELESSLSYANMVLDEERIIVAGHRRVACLDRTSGEIRWQKQIKTLSSPTSIALDKSVPGGQILLGCAGLLFCLWAESGELLWENGLKGWGYHHMCLRVPGALVAQPTTHVVSTGQSSRTYVTEDTQYQG